MRQNWAFEEICPAPGYRLTERLALIRQVQWGLYELSMSTESLDRLLAAASEYDASDLHLVAGVPPAFRVNGEIIIADEDAITEAEVGRIAESLLNEQQKKKFEQEWELCISLLHSAAGRLRATFYRRNGHPEMSFRFCGDRISTREELGLPEKIDDLARRPNGLVLITGATGAGKTTTLNYMVDLINSERRCKIVTIEDPIEFVHANKRAIVVQQEVLTDVRSFNRALIHVLRQDPDVIVVGEMRDFEAISTALTAAETGHLVLATMHSPSVSHALERIVGVFEGSAQRQIILQLSNALQGIIAQELLPAADRTRRVLAYELVVANGAVRNLIRENQVHQLENTIQTGRKEGMTLMDNCLYDLYCKCLITYDTALSRARHPERITRQKA
jgi:twitching motility protein PilT